MDKSFWINLQIVDYEKNIETRQYITRIVNETQSKIITDSLGRYSKLFFEGDYTFIAFGDTQSIKFTRDTTFYFTKKESYQNVNFQFLPDGNLVYLQIMNIDFSQSSDSSSN